MLTMLSAANPATTASADTPSVSQTFPYEIRPERGGRGDWVGVISTHCMAM